MVNITMTPMFLAQVEVMAMPEGTIINADTVNVKLDPETQIPELQLWSEAHRFAKFDPDTGIFTRM